MANRNITHKACSSCTRVMQIQFYSKSQLKKHNPRCGNCVQQSPSPLTVGSAFAPITPPMTGGFPQPRATPAAPGWGQGFASAAGTPPSTIGYGAAPPPYQPCTSTPQYGAGFGTPPVAGFGAGPAVATQQPGVGFGQQAPTVGFTSAAAAAAPSARRSPLAFSNFTPPHQIQQQQQQAYGFRAATTQYGGFGAQQPAVQAQRQLFAAADRSGDGSAMMDAEEELWLGAFAPQGGQQFATFQRQFAQLQHVNQHAAAAGTPAPDPKAVEYLQAMAAKGFRVAVLKAVEACKGDVNKASIVLDLSVKKLAVVKRMKRGHFKSTVDIAVAAHNGCFVRAWLQIEQAYKVVMQVQKQGVRGQTVAGKALQVANNDLVKAARLLIQHNGSAAPVR